LTVIFPARGDKYGFTAGQQAQGQALATLVTLGVAIIGGSVTGIFLRLVGECQVREIRVIK